jgi:hypothetical protein
MEFACRNLGQPPFGLMTPTKQKDLARWFNQARNLHGGVLLLSPK